MTVIGTSGNLIEVFKFQVYIGESDEMRTSRRYGTKRAIEEIVKGHVLYATKREIDRRLIESPNTDIEGLTTIGFDPDASTGFQTVVRG